MLEAEKKRLTGLYATYARDQSFFVAQGLQGSAKPKRPAGAAIKTIKTRELKYGDKKMSKAEIQHRQDKGENV